MHRLSRQRFLLRQLFRLRLWLRKEIRKAAVLWDSRFCYVR